MDIAVCPIHKIRYNPDTVNDCPICLDTNLRPREFQEPKKRESRFGIIAKDKLDYLRQYAKLTNSEERRKYKKEWTRKARAEQRLKYGKILY